MVDLVCVQCLEEKFAYLIMSNVFVDNQFFFINLAIDSRLYWNKIR